MAEAPARFGMSSLAPLRYCESVRCSFCGADVAWSEAEPAICAKCLALCRNIVGPTTGTTIGLSGGDRACSFCGRDKRRVVAGPTVFICEDCVARLS
jgi:hypothetical protein